MAHSLGVGGSYTEGNLSEHFLFSSNVCFTKELENTQPHLFLRLSNGDNYTEINLAKSTKDTCPREDELRKFPAADNQFSQGCLQGAELQPQGDLYPEQRIF